MKRLLLAVGIVVAAFPPLPAAESKGTKDPEKDAAWVDNLRTVHARFHGKAGTFAHFGDSITVTMAFWTPLAYAAKNASPEMAKALERVKARLAKECWRDWKGPRFGSEGGMTIRWAAENVDRWLKELEPETALILFGTNDLNALDLEEYREKTREVVRKCLDRGTVVILSTIPPRHGFEEKGKAFAEAVRAIARELKVPLIDFQAEVLKRRPDDWDGAAEKFKEFKDYDVPTLISRDGVHPSYPKKWADDYSEDGLRNSGYGLRSWLVLMAYARVIEKVLDVRAASPGGGR
jgi:lysophospholipase L1-like esterase